MLGRPERVKPEKPVLPARYCINHRLSRSEHQEYLVAWEDEGLEPTWEPVEDVSTDIMGLYQEALAKQCPLMPSGMDVAWLLKTQMNSLFYEVLAVLRASFVPFKQSRSTHFSSVASVPMSPEVFLHLFADALPPDTTPRSLLSGGKVVKTFAEARTLLDPFLAGWSRRSRQDHFISEVDASAPITFTFRLKYHETFDHTYCAKCAQSWTMRVK